MLAKIKPTSQEIVTLLPGDEIIPQPDIIMDRVFSLPASPEKVWPWFVQLGKKRAGWYLPRSVEHFILPKRRGLRRIEPSLQSLKVGDVIPDWGGKDATFEVALLQPSAALVFQSKRGKTEVSWAITMQAEDKNSTRVHLRLRLVPVRRKWLAESAGGLVDALTIAGLAAGLRQRLCK